MDCSGLVLRALHDSGLTLSDRTSQMLYDYALKKGVMSGERQADFLLFFGAGPQNVSHVAISLGVIDGEWLMVEAGGAGINSLNLSREELAVRDARVRIRKVSSRRDLLASIYVPYKDI